MKLRVFGLIFAVAVLLVNYQNCGNVRVQPQASLPPPSYLKVGGSFCPSIQADDPYVLQEFFAVNLTARASRFSGKFLADSDMDGIADIEEEEDFSLDPLNRRTMGVLDSVCVEAGMIGCNPGNPGEFLSFGLKTIDLIDQGNSGVYGVDQDQDRIPDFVELLFGTSVNVADADVSSDLPGGESNISEIKKGMAPRSPLDQNLSDAFKIKLNSSLDLSFGCGASSEGYSFRVAQLPMVETLAFSSVDEPYLNHAANENVVLFLVVSVRANGEQEVSYALRKVPLAPGQVDIEVSAPDFEIINPIGGIPPQ